MQGLMIHAGANRVEWDAILQAETPPPEYRGEKQVKQYVPVAHSALALSVKRILNESEYFVKSEEHALTKNGQRYFGLMELAGGHEGRSEVIGLQNSHDGAFLASLALGDRVFVCDNLAFNGEVTVSRKHTRFIHRDLDKLILSAVGQLGEYRQRHAQRLQIYIDSPLPETSAESLILRAYLGDVIPERKIKHVLAEWREPSHEEFRPRNVWSLFNAFTEHLKPTVKEDGTPGPTNLGRLAGRTQRLYGLLDATVGLSR